MTINIILQHKCVLIINYTDKIPRNSTSDIQIYKYIYGYENAVLFVPIVQTRVNFMALFIHITTTQIPPSDQNAQHS